MLNRTLKALTAGAISTALMLGAAAALVYADDTEIYQADYDETTGARAKVLIVLDDSGSMGGAVASQRPPYDPTETYDSKFTDGRLYWTTDGTVPDVGHNDWFNASQNRCASSLDLLDDAGRFTAERARRWVDSSVQQGQCYFGCAPGTTLLNPTSGNSNQACYEEVASATPQPKLVYAQNDGSGNSCPSNLQYVDPPGPNNDACYEWEVTTTPTSGYVFSQDDEGNACPSGLQYIDPPGSWNDGCYELVTQPVFTTWQYVGPRGNVCTNDVDIPGTWQALTSSVRTPPHVECLDDVKNANPGNGGSQADGYPQNDVSTGNEYASTVDPGMEWGNNPYTFFTAHYLDWFHDDSLVAPRPKMEIAADVITNIIETNPSVDFGLLEFNRWEGGRITQRIIQNMSDTQRTNLMDMIDDIDASGATPLCESHYEAYLYLAGKSPKYAGSASSVTGSDTDPADPLAVSGGKYVSPNTDCAYTYIIVVTDGRPNGDDGANGNIKALSGVTPTGANGNCSIYPDDDGGTNQSWSYVDSEGNTQSGSNGGEYCMPELAAYMANNDLDDDTTNGDQLGITYTIGFATDQQLLQDTADAGKGKYYTADDADELTEAFQGALVDILSRDTTFTSPAVAVDTFTRTESRDEVFYAMFKPNERVDWIGNIKKLKLEVDNGTSRLVDANGTPAIDTTTGEFKTTAVTYWGTTEDGGTVGKGGVGALLAARNQNTRSLYTNTGTNGALEALNVTNIDANAMGVANDAALYSLFGAATQVAFEKQVRWAQGYDAFDKDGDGATNDARDWILGDILHSQPLVVNYGARGTFTEENPDLRLIVGSNSGFVHSFKNSDGQESWAFFPKELAPILPQRRRNDLSSDHIYGMDLTPVSYIFDANKDGTLDSTAGDKAWVFLGMRRGGKSYYALDVSNPDSPSFMWRIGADVAGFSEMGQSWSEPVVTRIPGYYDNNGVAKPVLIFGAGYDTNKDASGVGTADGEGRGIFIVDAETGALVWSVTPGANSANNMSEAGLLHSVPGDVTALDSNSDGLADRIYFADTGGNIWRVDMPGNELPSTSQNEWFISKLGAFNGATTQTDRRFFTSPDVVRIRFQGEAVDALIIGSGDRTNPNATDVENSLYMIRDLRTVPYTTDVPSTTQCADTTFYDVRCEQPFTESSLYDITDNVLATGTATEQATARVNLNAANGWRMDLTHSGEKMLGKTLTINGRIFAPTFTPSSLLDDINICEPQSGIGRLYVIDLYEGDRKVINLGGIIPDTPSVHFGEKITIIPPPGTPEISIEGPGDGTIDCTGGICDIGEFLRRPYGNYWFQEDY